MYALSYSAASQGWMFRTIFLFLMDLVVENVSKMIQFGLIMLVVGASFVVWVMKIPTCNDYYPTQVLDADNGKFSAQCTVY